jgi:hypothetical protein
MYRLISEHALNVLDSCALTIRQLMVPQAERLSKLEHLNRAANLPRYLLSFPPHSERSFTNVTPAFLDFG